MQQAPKPPGTSPRLPPHLRCASLRAEQDEQVCQLHRLRALVCHQSLVPRKRTTEGLSDLRSCLSPRSSLVGFSGALRTWVSCDCAEKLAAIKYLLGPRKR